MEPAGTREAGASRDSNRASARSRHKRAAAINSPGHSTGIRIVGGRVHRREWRRPRAPPEKATAEEQDVTKICETNPIWSGERWLFERDSRHSTLPWAPVLSSTVHNEL